MCLCQGNKQQTYNTGRNLGGTEARGVYWPQAPCWRLLQGTAHSRQLPGASTSMEKTYGDTSWPKAGWSTKRTAALSCSCWCCVRQAGTGTCTLRCSYLQNSWSNLSGSNRTAGCWDTPTSCWQSSGGARRHWPGWGTEWAGRTQQASCGEAGTRSSSDQVEGERGCVCVPALCPASGCWTGSHQWGWPALGGGHQGLGWSPACGQRWLLAPLCSWSHRLLQACCGGCWSTCSAGWRDCEWETDLLTPLMRMNIGQNHQDLMEALFHSYCILYRAVQRAQLSSFLIKVRYLLWLVKIASVLTHLNINTTAKRQHVGLCTVMLTYLVLKPRRLKWAASLGLFLLTSMCVWFKLHLKFFHFKQKRSG